MGDLTISLPSLGHSIDSAKSSVRYKGVPRRYDETRPVAIQGFAHRKILGIGNDLHRRAMEMAEQEKLNAIRAAESAVWAEAEQMKAVAIQKVKEEALGDQEKVIRKLKKIHEKALKEEALRVEMAMQKLAIEQVKQERSEAEDRLKEAVKKTEERCQKEKEDAVEKARKEEKQAAADELKRISKINKDHFDTAISKAAEDKVKAVEQVRQQKDAEREKAVAEMEEKQKRIAAEQVKKLHAEFDSMEKKLKEQIAIREHKIELLHQQILEVEKAKLNVEKVLLETKVDFQHFIDNLPIYDESQSDYMVRPVYLEEIGRVKTVL